MNEWSFIGQDIFVGGIGKSDTSNNFEIKRL